LIRWFGISFALNKISTKRKLKAINYKLIAFFIKKQKL